MHLFVCGKYVALCQKCQIIGLCHADETKVITETDKIGTIIFEKGLLLPPSLPVYLFVFLFPLCSCCHIGLSCSAYWLRFLRLVPFLTTLSISELWTCNMTDWSNRSYTDFSVLTRGSFVRDRAGNWWSAGWKTHCTYWQNSCLALRKCKT